MSVYQGVANSVVGGNTVVASAGTPVQLTTANYSSVWVLITAAPANAGNITIGDADVDATADAENGYTLDAGQSINLPVSTPSAIYIDAGTSGDEVGWVVGKI